MTPIVLVPGLLCSAEVFAPQVVALWPYGPVTVACTLQGTTMAEMAAAILETAPQRFALAGISMGGYVCLEIMRQAPERVLKLALLDTSALPDAPLQTEMRRMQQEKVKEIGFLPTVLPALTSLLHPKHQDDERLREINKRMALAVGPEGFARQTEAAIGRADSRPSLTGIAVPTVVIVGENDLLTPPDRAKEMANAIAGARLLVVPECGHVSTLEQPEVVNRALVEWLAG